MNNAQADIRALVDSFVEQLTSLIRTSAVESVQAALLDGTAPGRRGRKPGPKPGPKPKAAKAKPAKAKKGKGGRRARRSPAEIAAAKAQILAHVKANPGTAMGDMSKALGMDAATIRAQVNEMLDAGNLRKEGERRGTKYFAGAGGGGKKATKRGKKAAKRGKRKTSKKRATKKKTARKSA